jgi:hypothetical protein
MGSRQADSEQLVDRCARAGWRVEAAPGKGYKVWDPTGKIHPVHLTYSAIGSLNRCREGLEKAGLAEAERAIANARITETRTRNDIAREAAETLAKKMANGTNLARAAGPYLTEAEEVPLDWFTTPHPRPWMRWAMMTPDIAAKILKDHNGDNRPLDPATVKWYRDIILAGLWHLTHQGWAFDVRGLLQDGQHRAAAICEAGELSQEPIRVPVAIFVGMPEENFKAIDEGRLRNARQLFAKGGEKYAGAMQTVVRLVYYLNDTDARRVSRLRLPNQTILDLFESDIDAYRDSVEYGAKHFRKIPGLSNPALGAAHYLIRKVNGKDNEYVHQFFEAITTGLIPGTRVILNDDDPRTALRKRLSDIKDALANGRKTERRSSLSQVGMIIATWNNTVSTRLIRKLYFNEDTTIPAPLRCIPGDGGVPNLFQSPAARQATSA